MSSNRWTVRLTATAEVDYRNIVRWTANTFGPMQAKVYAETLSSALKDLLAGPEIIGSKTRPEIGENLWTLHVERHGRKGRHFVVFRVNAARQTIDVLRLLHDSMELQRHL